MPIYEYECTECGKVEEVLQKFSEKPLTTCKSCSGNLHKLISHSSFHLKGSGWYVTDYANKGSQSSFSPDKKKEKEAPTPDKADKKPAAGKSTGSNT